VFLTNDDVVACVQNVQRTVSSAICTTDNLGAWETVACRDSTSTPALARVNSPFCQFIQKLAIARYKQGSSNNTK